jgi:hypothetical protein
MRGAWLAATILLLGALACEDEERPPLAADEASADGEYGCEAMAPHAGRCGPYRGIGAAASYPAGCAIRVGRCSCVCRGEEKNHWACVC